MRKKTWKQWIALLIAVLMAIALTACGGKKPAKEAASATTATRSTAATTTTRATEETTTLEETEEETTPETTTEVTSETTTTEETTTASSANDGIIRPEIKEAIDSYEAFVDEYCAFMETYDANDLTQLGKYMELLNKEIEMADKFDDLDASDLNDAELAYYTEVSLRCSQKLLEAAGR